MEDILVPVFRAKRDDDAQVVTGFYFAHPITTYCTTQDYYNHKVKMVHYILYSTMTDWGLPNKAMAATIDPTTLEFVGYQKPGQEYYDPENDLMNV